MQVYSDGKIIETSTYTFFAKHRYRSAPFKSKLMVQLQAQNES